jgi:hypothetical protein
MHTFNLFADHFQFYLQDEAIGGDLSNSWTDEAVSRLLAVAPGTVGVRTVRNLEVPVTVEVLASEPPLNMMAYDHIVEGSLSAHGRNLVLAGCTDYFPEAARIHIEPGDYRVGLASQASSRSQRMASTEKTDTICSSGRHRRPTSSSSSSASDCSERATNGVSRPGTAAGERRLRGR